MKSLKTAWYDIRKVRFFLYVLVKIPISISIIYVKGIRLSLFATPEFALIVYKSPFLKLLRKSWSIVSPVNNSLSYVRKNIVYHTY